MVTIANDPILVVNLILCVIILILGILCTKRSGEKLPLYIGISFGLFAVSHGMTLIDLKDILVIPLIITRSCAYLLVLCALLLYLKKTLIAQEAQEAWIDYYNEDIKPVNSPKKE
ncbi:MAG: hypothetical protein LUQ50_12735 [Methanospirillum sp.]|uniref:hypothetical protein n=1 Tax=Methanospirillum sp. TaxID=45200 RepID=UPI002370AA7F|nr:hypothetical protein [Methanospirillum sp.]MDD1729920.1 hypothetical protein [Methanospirillum sp.]